MRSHSLVYDECNLIMENHTCIHATLKQSFGSRIIPALTYMLATVPRRSSSLRTLVQNTFAKCTDLLVWWELSPPCLSIKWATFLMSSFIILLSGGHHFAINYQESSRIEIPSVSGIDRIQCTIIKTQTLLGRARTRELVCGLTVETFDLVAWAWLCGIMRCHRVLVMETYIATFTTNEFFSFLRSALPTGCIPSKGLYGAFWSDAHSIWWGESCQDLGMQTSWAMRSWAPWAPNNTARRHLQSRLNSLKMSGC